MVRKYELTDEKMFEGRTLYRIRALCNFGNVKKGDLGGFVESEANLSHDGNCWIYDNAKVFGNAVVCDNASIYGNAKVFDNAKICDSASVCNYSKVYDNAKVCGNAVICNNACVYGNAQVYDNARIFGNAKVCSNARVYGNAYVQYGKLTKDIKDDLVQYIACSLNVYPNPITKTYILYKRVNKIEDGIYRSLHDPNFIYRDGEIIEVKDYDEDFMKSCGKGLHVSTPFYWDGGDTLIAVEVHLDDIITCMEGKIRCKRLKVLGEIQTEV